MSKDQPNNILNSFIIGFFVNFFKIIRTSFSNQFSMYDLSSKNNENAKIFSV
ncbi:MAG: Uncharacterised protein [Flavobacteriaceae bacterium]|jgi:hypothetical protein|nr:MAG: Uncharacterised protein [Flavobacteriaceae bacterium]